MRHWLLLALMLSGCATSQPYYWSRSCYRRPTVADVVVDVAVGSLVAALLSPRPKAPPPPMRDARVASASTVHHYNGRVTTRVLIAGGHLKLVGLPAHSRDEVVLEVHPIARLDQACDVRLYRDGEPLTVGERVRRNDHELWATLRVEELGASQQLRGAACGVSFELDAAGRDTIAHFVARMRELSAAPSSPLARTVEQVTQRHVAVAD